MREGTDMLHPLLAFDDGPAGALPAGAGDGRGADAAPQEQPERLAGDNDDIDDLALQRWWIPWSARSLARTGARSCDTSRSGSRPAGSSGR